MHARRLECVAERADLRVEQQPAVVGRDLVLREADDRGRRNLVVSDAVASCHLFERGRPTEPFAGVEALTVVTGVRVQRVPASMVT